MKINYLAVVLSAAAYWMVGGLWYGVLFGPRWMALENLTIEQTKSMTTPLAYIITFVLDLVMAYVLAQFCVWRNVRSAIHAAAIGLMMWIGIVAPITYTTMMYEMRPKELFVINEFYPLVGLCASWVSSSAPGRKSRPEDRTSVGPGPGKSMPPHPP